MPNITHFKTHEDYLKWYSNYRKNNKEKWKEYRHRYSIGKRRDRENRFKELTRNITRRAVLNGTLVKLPCEFCGNPEVEAHHKDYTKPYDIQWVCVRHHAEIEKQKRKISN